MIKNISNSHQRSLNIFALFALTAKYFVLFLIKVLQVQHLDHHQREIRRPKLRLGIAAGIATICFNFHTNQPTNG